MFDKAPPSSISNLERFIRIHYTKRDEIGSLTRENGMAHDFASSEFRASRRTRTAEKWHAHCVLPDPSCRCCVDGSVLFERYEDENVCQGIMNWLITKSSSYMSLILSAIIHECTSYCWMSLVLVRWRTRRYQYHFYRINVRVDSIQCSSKHKSPSTVQVLMTTNPKQSIDQASI